MSDRLLLNAKILLEASCRARAGDSVLVLVTTDAIAERAAALVAAALELGLLPTVMDIRGFVGSPAYRQGRLLEPVKAAIEAADIVLNNIVHVHDSKRPDFSRLLGDPDIHDKTLDGERRWVYVQCAGMDEWRHRQGRGPRDRGADPLAARAAALRRAGAHHLAAGDRPELRPRPRGHLHPDPRHRALLR